MLTPKLFRKHIIAHTQDFPTVDPVCPHAPPHDFCGGCTFQTFAYPHQVEAKSRAMQQLWQEHLPESLPTPQVIGSPQPLGYRTRMDFIASKGRFGLRRGGKFNYIVDLNTCHLIPEHGFEIAHTLWQSAIAAGLSDYNLRSHEGFLRYIVMRRSPQNTYLVALITTAPSDTDTAIMEDLAQQALTHPDVQGVHWLRNDGVADMSFGTPFRHWGEALLAMQVGDETLWIGPNTFFQNNIYLLDQLLAEIKSAVGQGGRTADLYGGVGTIALSLASQVDSVHCVESVAESVELCHHNIAQSTHKNVTAELADVAAFLKDTTQTFDTMVVDPPRVGLGEEVCKHIVRLAPRTLVYVSCNPLSQLDDYHYLRQAYRLVSLNGYDMFPQTPHFESLAVFVHQGESS
jgi:23S rRNA (uracil-5-)-methyltransferase RumA